MLTSYEFAAASVTGHRHATLGRNNQDAYLLTRVPETYHMALVADGCGSGAFSEFGARLGIRCAARAIRRSYDLRYREVLPNFQWWDYVTASIASELRTVLGLLNVDESQELVVKEHLLFTLLGVIIDDQSATFFAAGDGLLLINNELHTLEAANNAPAYLGYLTLPCPPPLAIGLRPIVSLPTSELESFVLASDGAVDLLNVNGKSLPRRTEAVMNLEHYPSYDAFFANPDRLRRYLSLINRELVEAGSGASHKGTLADDTTIVIGRTRKEL